ncbi:MAG: alginate export family protein [Bdellovibrionales bacterium]|nr:alginate export family protein [Bdellovibrionales bacterium]
MIRILMLSVIYIGCLNSFAMDLSFSSLARIRYESLTNYDFDESQSDYRAFTSTRMWMAFKAQSKEYHLFFQPQFGRPWGQSELGSSVSGTTKDPYLSLHQAYISVPVFKSDKVFLSAGRQELAYGDQLVLGSVGWSTVGRSFDSFKMKWLFGKSYLDVFSAKLSENNFNSGGSGDKDLTGIYFSGKYESEFVQEADAYLLSFHDSTVTPDNDVLSYGLRFSGSLSPVKYRVESTIQDSDEFQIDAELAAQMGSIGNIAVSYFVATKNYNQLFPTGHKWLGIMDIVSRRNIKGFNVQQTFKWSNSISHTIAYNKFNREDLGQTAFSFSGAPLGLTLNDSEDIGDEVDFVFNYDRDENLSYQLGGGYFRPGDYLEKNGLTDLSEFCYLQMLLKF